MTHRTCPCLRLAALSLAALLAACAQTTPDYDQRFGATARAALAGQIANPGGPVHPDPVAGMDGRSAALALGRYQKSFAEPAAQPVTFMIGGSGGR